MCRLISEKEWKNLTETQKIRYSIGRSRNDNFRYKNYIILTILFLTVVSSFLTYLVTRILIYRWYTIVILLIFFIGFGLTEWKCNRLNDRLQECIIYG